MKINPYYYQRIGENLVKEGKLEKALKYIEILISNNCFLNAAKIIMKANKEIAKATAEKYGRAALQKYESTNDRSLLLQAAEIFSELDNKEETRKIANILFGLRDYYNAGVYYAEIQDFENAISCLEKLSKTRNGKFELLDLVLRRYIEREEKIKKKKELF